MPTVPANTKSRVLVTGANGYVAMWLVRVLLEQGYFVRGTVRSESKGKQLDEHFGSYGNKFEWVVVNDITKEGAFDEFVMDVDAIEHTASPVSPESQEDPQEYIRPAVQGTVSILTSAMKFGTNVKRVVVTSSVAALSRTVTGLTILDEKDWGDEFVKAAEELGTKADGILKYLASKNLSERATWEFYAKHKAKLGWDLVVLNPSHVIGPPLQDFRNLGEETLSLQRWYNFACQDQDDDFLKTTYNYVDVRDVAAAHVEAIKKEAAGGERIIISADSSTWQDTRNMMFSLRPDLYTSGVLPRGNAELTSEILLVLNSQKAQKILGIKYKSLEESTLATLAEYETRGLLG
ncbi:hypothetical protein CVT25_010776 [Psilocybe cyanescens]|uniref:NAD-dependent epimerase/dehydratase domain-containing protein n=1 Tax=Psilocybe cyanescens TaxID=93625 RepID=A0A409XQS1_PSICY|nr:hypothetical protein CVT25_010776 [Psilocybe cyanescens]